MTPQMPSADEEAGGGGGGILVSTNAPASGVGENGDVALVTGSDDVSPSIAILLAGESGGNQTYELQLYGDTTGAMRVGWFNGVTTEWSDYFNTDPDAPGDTLIGRVDTAMGIGGPPFSPASVAAGSVYEPDGGIRTVRITFVGHSYEYGDTDVSGVVLQPHLGGEAALYVKDGESWVPELYGTKNPVSADVVPYDNSTSGLAALQLQEAVDELAASSGGGGGGSNLPAYWKTSVSAAANSASSWVNIGPALSFNPDGESAYEVTFRVPTVEVVGAAQGHIRVYDEESGMTHAVGHFATAGKRPAVIGGLMLPSSDPMVLRAQIKFESAVAGTLKADSTLGGMTYAAELVVVKLGVPPEV